MMMSLGSRSVTDVAGRSPANDAPRKADHLGAATQDLVGAWHQVPLTPGRLRLHVMGGPTALAVYRPERLRARAGAWVAKTLVGRSWARRTGCEIAGLASLVDFVGVEADSLAVMRSSMPERHIVGVGRDGQLTAVLKVGSVEDEPLRNEIEMLRRLQGARTPFAVPLVLWAGHWNDRVVLATRAAPVMRRSRPIDLTAVVEICNALQGEALGGPMVHGDLAPWNIIESAGELTILDWETGSVAHEPLHDLSHFIVQAGALLGRYAPKQAVDLLTTPAGPGCRHLEAIGIDPGSAAELVARYLLAVASRGSQREHRFRAEVDQLINERVSSS